MILIWQPRFQAQIITLKSKNSEYEIHWYALWYHKHIIAENLDFTDSDKTFSDTASIAKFPFVASHSNAKGGCPNDRSLSYAMHYFKKLLKS